MTFHLHISGRVQGVGFRPHVYKYAIEENIRGYVSNERDGVHVTFNLLSQSDAEVFAERIIKDAPSKAMVQSWHVKEIPSQHFHNFSILVRTGDAQPHLLVSPDFSMCEQCRGEFHDPGDRRYHYPFITCTQCGPRFSIMKQLPYERCLTTMDTFKQCPDCEQEYGDMNDRRYFSQTNSCAVCGVKLSWLSKSSSVELNDPDQILSELLKAFREGKIIAVKGIGGFLLMCDATNRRAIETLRQRKHRPKKPFAVLFPHTEMVEEYAFLNSLSIKALSDEASPIVLLRAKEECFRQLDMAGVAPGLSSIGVMMPYAPLLEWITTAWKNPLIATSGNVSGSCIVFQSSKKEALFQFADFILDHNRGIVIPQDDSVVRFGRETDVKIMIRRARGFAPSVIVPLRTGDSETIFAAGAMLKSTFAFQHNNQIYLSQFLGNLESYDTQENYKHTFNHFRELINADPKVILADLHPDYPSTQIAMEYSKEYGAQLKKIQHHEAHFAAIMGEHDLFDCGERILGIIWDGTGLGTDGNIWGGEFFLYENGKIKRVHYLEPFTNIGGDKMAIEPRLAALAISRDLEDISSILKSRFSKQEWDYYQKEITRQGLQNTSAGRYFDAIAALLDIVDVNSYEGEAALALEQYACDYVNKRNIEVSGQYFDEEIDQEAIPMKQMIRNIVNDIQSGRNKEEIAALFHMSLVAIIGKVVHRLGVRKIAFSGGVFQNHLLVDLIHTQLKNVVHLELEKVFEFYFHRQMPPNDECVSFGQIMHYYNIKT